MGIEFETFTQKSKPKLFTTQARTHTAPTSTIWSWHWSLLTSSLLRTEMNSASLLAICVALKSGVLLA